MRFLHRQLCRLLKISSYLEVTSREKTMAGEVRKVRSQMAEAEKIHCLKVEDLEQATAALQQNIIALQQIIDARDKTIEGLEHEVDILKYDLKGMTSVNARLAKWVETIRVAEDKPLKEQDLAEQLADIEGSVPWAAS